MRFSVLASGSRGNVCYIETEKAGILVDAGLSCREMLRRLGMIKFEAKRFDALVITHEHNDHIKGAGAIARKLNVPLILNSSTLERGREILGRIPEHIIIQTGRSIRINDMVVETFTKCHDAADPIGIIVSSNGTRLGIVTDLGRSTRLIADRLKKCDAVLIEFNHDVEMLEQGPYPLNLKKRIRGAEGHRSNDQACDLLREIAHPEMKQVILAHISEKNNLPDVALNAARKTLNEIGMGDIPVYIGCQDDPCPIMDI